MRSFSPLHRTAVRAAAVVSIAALSGCRPAVLDPAGPVSAGERTILLNSLFIMLGIVVPTILATLSFAWWFRAGNRRALRRPDWTYSGAIELVTWSIPVLVVLFLGGIAWISAHELDPARPLTGKGKPLAIQVVSLDWKWLFIYPEQGIASINEIAVPAGSPVAFTLTSASVMNTFFVPRLGSMIYTMNGMVTRLSLQADAEGDFEGLSGHFSGDGFPGMRFRVRALKPDDFVRWTEDAKRSDKILDADAYSALAVQSSDLPPGYYRLTDPHLFHAIASQVIAPGPGPQKGRAGPSVSPRQGG